MPTTKPISPKRIRQKKRAALALAGVTYREIASQMGSSATPASARQTVYNSLHTPGGQEALREAAIEMYDKAKVKRIINDVLDSIQPDTINAQQTRVLEMAARTEAMLTDRNINENRNIDLGRVRDASELAPEQLEEELLKVLRLSHSGVASETGQA